jgi:acetate kinase
MNSGQFILTVNAGSSSIKFALFSVSDDNDAHRVFDGAVLSIGWPGAKMTVKDGTTADELTRPVTAPDHDAAAKEIIEWIKPHIGDAPLRAVGHRVVHGGPFYHEAQIVTDEVLARLTELVHFDPLHLPNELKLIRTFQALFQDIPQIACFDTAFHHDLPRVARLLPIPRRYEEKGIRRYGFHGLSCEFIMRKLEEIADTEAKGRIIIAHLGNGVSLTAIKNGKSVDTTMALTPAAGVPMSTRSGDIDPGLVRYLADAEGKTAQEFDTMINDESGLIGISETTSDMEELLHLEANDIRAKEAVDVFCYSIKKSLAALTAVMGGVDTVVFTGGMGENAPKVRERICAGLEFIGMTLAPEKNDASAEVISASASLVKIRVLHTDEALTIVREASLLTEKENE